MNFKWRNNLLQAWLILLIAWLAVNISSVPAAITATIAAPVVIDLAKTPGSTFTIDVTIANVEKMWGYKFTLLYNTTLLTATSYSSYSPFTEVAAAKINDTGGYVYMSYSMPFGEHTGFSTVDAKPIARIDFTVDESGSTELGFIRTVLADVDAIAIPVEEVPGFFANIELPNHDVAVTELTVSPTSVAYNNSVTITVTVENLGDFSETFNVSAYYDTTLIKTETGITLAAGASTTLTFTWRAKVPDGNYAIKCVASHVPGETDFANNTRNADDSVTVGAKGTGSWPPPYLWYLIVGVVVIVIVIAVLVYVLRSRKPKSP